MPTLQDFYAAVEQAIDAERQHCNAGPTGMTAPQKEVYLTEMTFILWPFKK